jgi:glycine/D-amino acid oxidase-like deaminating enzyme
MLNIEHLSYWERKTFFEQIDFIVIGAGIVGYSSAIHLKEKYPDAKILILEKGYLPSGASSKNAGFACFGSTTELLDDLNLIDEFKVWETVQKRWEGLQYLQRIVGVNNLNLENNGSWDLIRESQDVDLPEIREKLSYLNEKTEEITGQKAVFSEDLAIKSTFGFDGIQTSFFNRLEGQIDTGKMIRRYFQIAIEKKIDVLFGIQVESFESFENEVQLKTNIGSIRSSHLLVCTNGFAAEMFPEDVKPARAQVIVTQPIPNLKIKGTFHYDKGYYYFRNIDQRILLGGGRNLDFEGETTTELKTSDRIMNSLETLLNEVILPGHDIKIDYRWAGIMGVGNTKAPIIKKTHTNVGIGVRMGGMGVAIGSLVGKELAEMF